MATRDEYADQLRPLTLEGCYGKVIALLRVADVTTIGDDAAFREEVRTILEAHDVAADERVARLSQAIGAGAVGRQVKTATCNYGRAASCRTPCEGDVDQDVVYTSSRHGNVLSREPVCRGHADEALARARGAGTMARTELWPIGGRREGVAS